MRHVKALLFILGTLLACTSALASSSWEDRFTALDDPFKGMSGTTYSIMLVKTHNPKVTDRVLEVLIAKLSPVDQWSTRCMEAEKRSDGFWCVVAVHTSEAYSRERYDYFYLSVVSEVQKLDPGAAPGMKSVKLD